MYTKITEKHIGQKIIMFRAPKRGDWPTGCGEISHERIFNVPITLGKIYTNTGDCKGKILSSKEKDCDWYPIQCFRLVNDFSRIIY